MKKSHTIIITLITAMLFLYLGLAVKSEHPMDRLFTETIQKINKTHVVNFKSGFAVNEYSPGADPVKDKPINQWQMKREGTYDAWSKYLNFRNVLQFTDIENKEDVEEKTSLSENGEGNMVLMPTMETYFKNGMLYTQSRDTENWSYQSKDSYQLLELLPLHSEVLNRYAKHYKSENRGKFVVFFFSVDPNYLTRTFSNILESDHLQFPLIFREGTIKMLVYPDTKLPRRIYAIYRIENTTTGELVEYHIDTWFSENEDYEDMDEPAIPQSILQTKRAY